jgi:hypothetical protein
MRVPIAAALILAATPALAQFPPPGIYPCRTDLDQPALGTLSLLVAGDYQWAANGTSATGQIASAGNIVEAVTGPLADQHWRGSYSEHGSETVFSFATDIGNVICY